MNNRKIESNSFWFHFHLLTMWNVAESYAPFFLLNHPTALRRTKNLSSIHSNNQYQMQHPHMSGSLTQSISTKSIMYPAGKRARLHWFYMYPDDSYIKLAPSGSTTHNFLLCMLPAHKCSCTTELMCMTEFKKCSIHDVVFSTLLPLDLSYNGLIEFISINSSQSNRNLPRVGG